MREGSGNWYHNTMSLIARLILSILGLLVIAHYVPGIELDSLYIATIVAVIFAVFSVTIKPLLHVLALPITLITFGLFAFIVNAFLFWFTASFIEGFVVLGFVPALVGSVAYSILSWLINKII